ncbi:hypothetical protein DB346_19320 [Verrucomicrobia bacterium LW23]|nr:hypothetical protein DB346_19320 [Verrucomicrobia bacterium LW23]
MISLPKLRRMAGIGSLMLLSLAAAATPGMCENLLPNGDFEQGEFGWYIFAPQEVKDNCSYARSSDEPQEGSHCGKLNSTVDARYAITNGPRNHVCKPGDRYRVSAWVRAGQDFATGAKTPGFCMRVSLYSQMEGYVDSKAGHFMLGLGNKAYFGKSINPLVPADPVPPTWTKLEGIFELPEDVQKVGVAIFSWNGQGTLYVDDVQLEIVDKSSTLTPLIDSDEKKTDG